MALSISHILQPFLTVLPVTVCSLITFWLFLMQLRYWRRERLWLIAWSFTATVLYACHAVYFSHPDELSPIADTLYVVCNLAVYPLYLLYILSITRGRCPRSSVIALLLGPAVMGGITVGTLYGMMSAEQMQRFCTVFLQGNSMSGLEGLPLMQAWAHVVCRVMFALQVFGVVFAGLRDIRRHDEEIAMDYADTDGRTLASLRIILWLMLVTAVISFAANAVGRHWFADSVWLLMLPSLTFSLLLAIIGWEGLMYGLVTVTDTYPVSSLTRHLSSVVADATATAGRGIPGGEGCGESSEVLSARIAQTLRERKLFLRRDLKLADVASYMQTNRTYMWQALKDNGMTFSGLVNEMRVEYAAKLLRQHPDMEMPEVSVNSGYASVNSFYRNFRSIMRCSPREYAKRYGNSKTLKE